MPARALGLCLKQRNGQYSCPYCYNPGITIDSDHLHRYWPTKHDAIARTHTSVVGDVMKAVDLRHAVRLTLFINNMYVFYSYILVFMQVKGITNVVSPLLALPRFDVVEGAAIEWMYVVCSDFTRSLLDRWLTFFDKSTLLVISKYLHLCVYLT